ncbi:MAG: 3-hydroxyacyl-CoA dehydrogenase family protein [Candidatus Thermoplasmatota archaeon]|jgi:3-hydroxybutyryl-CoA dehydrogenase|nr:3-hydroxyacyl-CoA dehydrogenase family protein [Candidatus Thermoplasmatota archaeon]
MIENKTVFVIGAGIMGSGIAEIVAINGYNCYLYDISDKILDKAMNDIGNSIEKLKNKKVLNENKEDILARIKVTKSLKIDSKPSIVIEVAPEKMDIKKSIFSEIDGYYPDTEILASNTSSLSISEMASVVKMPEKVIGLHFFNPPVLMKLVEIIPGYVTSYETIEKAKNFVADLKKEVTMSKDYPGFVTSRMLAVIINEAAWMLYEGIASKEDIDKAVNLGLNHPMGPLALADLVGIDTLLHILERLHTGFGDDKYRPSPVLRNMVYSNRLGRKSGEGFYRYK